MCLAQGPQRSDAGEARTFAVDDSLFIVAPIVCGSFVFGHCIAMHRLSVLSIFCNILAEQDIAGCFTLIGFLMSCDC